MATLEELFAKLQLKLPDNQLTAALLSLQTEQLSKERKVLTRNTAKLIDERESMAYQLPKLKEIYDDKQQELERQVKQKEKINRQIISTEEMLESATKQLEELRDKISKKKDELADLRARMGDEETRTKSQYLEALERKRKIAREYPYVSYLIDSGLNQLPRGKILLEILKAKTITTGALKQKIQTIPSIQILRYLKEMQENNIILNKSSAWELTPAFIEKVTAK